MFLRFLLRWLRANKSGVHPLAPETGKRFAFFIHMQTLYGAILKDGDDPWMVVPHNKTAELYTYLRGFGFSFTVDCRGFCEDNVFCFNEGENLDRLQAIIGQFPLN